MQKVVDRKEIEKWIHQIVCYNLPDTMQNRSFEELKKRHLENDLEIDSIQRTELFYRMVNKLKVNPDVTKLSYIQTLEQLADYLYQQTQGKQDVDLKEASKGPTPGPSLSFFNLSPSAMQLRLNSIEEKTGSVVKPLSHKLLENNKLRGHIENYVGDTLIPTGIIGPLLVKGESAKGSFYVPLVTTEGALVATVHRGAMVINAVEGANVRVLESQMIRSPVLLLKDLWATQVMEKWIHENFSKLQDIVSSSAKITRLKNIEYYSFGRRLTLRCLFHTGDAAGQNMVTSATERMLAYITQNSPVAIEGQQLDNNLSGDKKLNMLNFTSTRGMRVTAEVAIPRNLVEAYFHTTPEKIVNLYHEGILGGHLSGTIGSNAHFANMLSACYLATGQDMGAVHESSVGITLCELNQNNLIVTILLPALIVGTVGGGTSLPSQVENLKMMECYQQPSTKLAEIIAVTVLAGEISILGAHAAGDFFKAHPKASHPN